MPIIDTFTPAGLAREEKDILKSYGGYTNFLLSYGLKAYNIDDQEEGESILRSLGEDVRQEKLEAQKEEAKKGK